MSASDAVWQRVVEGVCVSYRAAVGGRAASGDWRWRRSAECGGCDAAKFAGVVAVIVGDDTIVVAFVSVSGSLGDKPNLTLARRHWTSRTFDVQGSRTAYTHFGRASPTLKCGCHPACLRELVGGVFFQERVVEV